MARWDLEQLKEGTGEAAGMAMTLGVQEPSSECTETKERKKDIVI